MKWKRINLRTKGLIDVAIKLGIFIGVYKSTEFRYMISTKIEIEGVCCNYVRSGLERGVEWNGRILPRTSSTLEVTIKARMVLAS
jgi:hypothetical protein